MAKRVDTTCRSKQKMETDRPHRSNSINNNSSSSISNGSGSGSCSNTTTTSELSICFTSRLSSSSSSYSSMKISSKSILSPGRPGEPSQTLLSSSLSRRLRSNGSMKGGQASPMFRTTTSSGKKRGCSFENPEPSSPKVTCIGQVRVKTKNKSKKITRTRSNRRREVNFKRLEQSNNIEASSNHQDCEQSHMNHQFANHHQQQQQQECLSHRNQRWVHLPVLICEALRAFGAEFNCFLPCRSPCLASQKEKGDTTAPAAAGSSTGSSCGSVFARWLVSMQEGDGKGRGIELVVEEEDEEREESRQRSYRRHVFEEIEFKDENFEGGNKGLQEEEARVSICIPPKNALLLMRCRSDPVRMAALANKFWDAPVPRDDVDEEDGKEQQEDDEKEVPKGAKDGNEEEEEEEDEEEEEEEEEERNSADEIGEDEENVLKQELVDREDLICEHGSFNEAAVEHQNQEIEAIPDVLEVGTELEVSQPIPTQDIAADGCLLEAVVDQGDLQSNENKDKEVIQGVDYCQEQKQEEQEQEQEVDFGDCVEVLLPESSVSVEPEQEAEVVGQDLKESMADRDTIDKSWQEEDEGEKTLTHERTESNDPKTRDGQLGFESEERNQPLLPDCLLLMMCEPKLSMEVSKETWVCTTDFIKYLPEHSRPVNKKSGKDEEKKRTTLDSNPAPAHINLPQARRSSCSYPAKPPARLAGTESMATVIEQRLVGTKDYEPFVLTRCKSEPMKSAAKLAPEACFWKNRKLEPHRPATVGVGTAGVGF